MRPTRRSLTQRLEQARDLPSRPSSAAAPPTANPQRAPATSANQPTIGAPIVVEPRKAIDQKAITRPRICGELSNCKRLFPRDEKLIEKIPTSTMTNPVRNRLGMNAAARTASPNRKQALTSLEKRIALRLAKTIPPEVAPIPIAAVKKA